MFGFFKDLLHLGGKVADGSIGNGVSRKQSHEIKKKGKQLESDIEKVLKQCGFHVVKNVYIPFQNKQGYTEVDLVAVNRTGILIIESKNYNGKVSGYVTANDWHVKYGNGKTYKMYNPVRQNEGHMKHLTRYLDLDKNMSVRSLIVFSPNAELHIKDTNLLAHNVGIITLNQIPFVVSHFNNSLSNRQVSIYIKELQSLTNPSKYVEIKQRRTANKYKKGY